MMNGSGSSAPGGWRLMCLRTFSFALARRAGSIRRSGVDTRAADRRHPPGLNLGGFDFAVQPSVNKGLVESLATCAWIREHETVLIQGPPGVGKIDLAVSFGVKAVENGFSVAFFRLDEMLQSLKQDGDLAPQRLRRKKYMNVALLIIDEVGFQPMNRQEASLYRRSTVRGT